MPLSDDDMEMLNGSFEGRGMVTVLVGPCMGKGFKGDVIPLDGHHYRCGGQVILHNRKKFRANLSLRTHTFEFLEAAWCRVGNLWYHTEEPAFLEDLKLTKEEAFPFGWRPDVPLEVYGRGPFPMKGSPPHPRSWFPDRKPRRSFWQKLRG